MSRVSWAKLAVLLAVVVLLVVAWTRAKQATDALAKERDAARLALAGFKVAAETSERGLKASLADLTRQSADLAAEVERLKKASPGAKPTSVFTGSTGALPATPPSIVPVPGADPTATVCLFKSTDKGSVFVSGATLETRAGNRVMVAVIDAYRVDPAPSIHLFGGPLKLDVAVEAEPNPKRWGAGVGAWAGSWGWAVGPALALPPLRTRWVDVEVVVAAGLSPNGSWLGSGTAIARY
jgi:Sec-independent protein translocase protein TatA